MITEPEVIPLLVRACPSFEAVWADNISSPGYEVGLLFVDMGTFACHLVDRVRSGDLTELPAVFAVVESLLVEGDSYVHEAAVTGLLEGIQNVASNSDLDPEVFRPYLGREARKSWEALTSV